MINRNSVELDDDYDGSSKASSDALSKSPAQETGDDEDDQRLENDDVSCMGSEKYLNEELDKLAKDIYEHTLAWSTHRNYFQSKEKEAKEDYGNKTLWPYIHDMLVFD